MTKTSTVTKTFDVMGHAVQIASDPNLTDPFSRWLRRDWQPEDHSRVAAQLLGEGDLMLDLGANYGTFSVPITVIKGSRCIAFEALRRNIPVLHAAIEANGIADKYQWVLAAITGAAGEVRIAGESAYGTVGTSGQRVLSYGLDDLLDEFDLSGLKLIKMDIEGCEMEALQGANRFFEIFPDVSFIFEANAAHSHRQKHLPQDLLKFFEDRGYILYLCKYGRLTRRTSSDFQESGVSDYIASKTPLESTVTGFSFDDFDKEHKIKETRFSVTEMKHGYRLSAIDQMHLAPDWISNDPVISSISSPSSAGKLHAG